MSSESGDDLDKILKADPFGQLSRKERKLLLLMSVIAIAVSKAGLVPTKIVGFGIEFSNIDRSAILWLLVVGVLYSLITFLAYALSDFFSWQVRYNEVWFELASKQAMDEDKYGPGKDDQEAPEPYEFWKRYSNSKVRFKRATWVKITLELGVPVLVGLAAIIIAAMAAWCQAGAKTP